LLLSRAWFWQEVREPNPVQMQSKTRNSLFPAPRFWETERQCLPSMFNLKSSDQEKLTHMLDQLIESGHTFSEWLGDNAGVSKQTQKQLLEQSKSRFSNSACGNVLSLINMYRDKCAKLIKDVTAQFKSEQENEHKQALKASKSVNAEMDCTGSLEIEDENVPIFKEPTLTAQVNILSSIVMIRVKSKDGHDGIISGEVIGVMPNFLRYKVISSTIAIAGNKPNLVGIDRTSADVSIFYLGEKSWTMWLRCKVRQPQF
jgi:hypothetical protein